VQPASAKLIDFYEQRGMEVSRQVFFDQNQSLQIGDIIIYNGTVNLRVSIGWVADCQEIFGK
jgi:hypothetical protein